MNFNVIAIDGPAASGKSTVASQLAKRLGYTYVNSGAMYRAITWKVCLSGASVTNPDAIAAVLDESHIRIGAENGESFIRIDGFDPTPYLRDEQINRNVSPVSSVPAVRELLLGRLRAFADEVDVVMEGRDIGSAVFPDTPFKFYIDASPEVRRQRRSAQGQTDEITFRDKADSTRQSAPLTIADDAYVIDSSHLTIDGVVGEIIGRLKLKGLAIS
ncbi:MAG TPA: (d)CMP kinase [Chthoniobacterales bacterium]